MSIDMKQHFSYGKLLKYTAPTMGTMLFTSIYGIVDGFFVSNFAGKTAFAAVNFIMPIIMILGTVGFMVGTGGNALVSKTRGEGDGTRANRQFSLMIYFAFACGVALAVIGALGMRQISIWMGASGEMLDMCTLYGRLSMISLPFFILQFTFQPFCSAAGKPKLGLAITVVAGVANIVLDILLVGVLQMGITGAAIATVVSEYLGGGIPLLFFARKNSSFLKLGKTSLDLKTIGATCANGSSEMMANIALSVVSVAYNLQLMRYIGPDGVAAYGVIMYMGMVFSAIFIGYSVGSAPLMAYQYGANNHVEMRSLLKKGLIISGIGGVLMLAAAEITAPAVAGIYTSYDKDLFDLTVYAFRAYSLSFALMGFSIFGSSLFTSLCNGKVSALISFLRTLLFELGAVIILPLLFGASAIWFSVILAEAISTALVAFFIIKLGPRYGLRGRIS